MFPSISEKLTESLVGIKPKICPLAVKLCCVETDFCKISSCQFVFAVPNNPTSPGFWAATKFLKESPSKTLILSFTSPKAIW